MQAHAFDSRGRLAAYAVMGVCFLFGGYAAKVHASEAVTETASASQAPTLEEGVASYYSRRLHGRRTASGEHYDMHAFTAAHRSLPLGSYVRVTDLSNQKSVVVRINDRGPFEKSRVIDLSFAAARLLGLQGKGTARVTLEPVSADEARQQIASVASEKTRKHRRG
jgi:rare lipoprotein A